MLKLQKNAKLNGEKNNKPISDAKLIFASFMGSALGVYVFMFILKYRIKSILFMTLIPVLIALNVFLFVFLYRNGLNFFV